jgi:hypothetical protein
METWKILPNIIMKNYITNASIHHNSEGIYIARR